MTEGPPESKFRRAFFSNESREGLRIQEALPFRLFYFTTFADLSPNPIDGDEDRHQTCFIDRERKECRMTSRESLPTREPDEKIPDGSLGFLSVAAGASPAAKFLLAVTVAELIRKGKSDDDPYAEPRRPTGPDIVRLPERSAPLRWFDVLFDIEPKPEFQRELLGVVFRYMNDQGLVVKPVFTRIESQMSLSNKIDGFWHFYDFTLYVEPAFASRVREHAHADELERMFGWPVGLLMDILSSVWTPPEITLTGERVGLRPTEHRAAYIVQNRPAVCPFCGRETISTIETGFLGDPKLRNAVRHGLLSPVSSPVSSSSSEHHPTWVCTSCGLGLKLPDAPYRPITREEIERQLQASVENRKTEAVAQREQDAGESLEAFLAHNA